MHTDRFHFLSKTMCLLVTAGFLGSLSAAEFTVDDVNDAHDADLMDNVCRTASGKCTLRAAVEQAGAMPGTDVIVVPEGVYELTTGQEITIKSNLSIRGVGADKVTISGGSSSRVFRVKGGASVTISGVTITRGRAYDGGGIGVWGPSSKLSLSDSTISDNASTNNGAGLYISNSKAGLENVTFSSNSANGSGGAIYIVGKGSALTIHKGSLTNNVSINGGGLYCSNAGGVRIEDSSVNSNIATGNTRVAGGGGIYNYRCSISLNRVTFDQNRAEKRGGAVFNSSGASLSVVDSTFSGNVATREDGGAIYSNGTLNVQTASLSANTANFGSALYDGGSATLSLVTVSGNDARTAEGAAIYHNSTLELTIRNSTIANNGNGNVNNALGGINLTGALLADAASGTNCVGTITSSGYNLDSDGSCALSGEGDISNVNPLLLALQDNGGNTLTHGLDSGSPAIDAGPAAGCPPLDQRFYTRAGRCDIGAFEVGGTAAQTGTVSFKSAVYMARESDGVVSITLTRSGGSEGAVSVDYRDDVLSKAAAGWDFVDFDGKMEWADGESGDKSFGVQIVPDANDEGIEPLTMVIGNPVGGVAIGEPRKAVLDIVDDDVQFGALSFGEPSYTAKEAAGTLVITVERSGGSDGVVSVKYATADKEATAEKDYTAVSGTLTFGDGETSKSISIPIINDNIDEPDETFIIRLSDLSGGATEGSYVEAVVTIADDDETAGGATGGGEEPAGGSSAGNGDGVTKASSGGGGGGSLDLLLLFLLLGGLLVVRRPRGESC